MTRLLIIAVIVGCVACKSNKSTSAETATSTEVQEGELKPSDEQAKVQEQPTEQVVVENEVNVVAVEEATMVEENANSEANIVGTWQITTISENDEVVELPYDDWNMQLSFAEEGNQVSIKSPCNSGFCSYLVTNSDIAIETECGFTEMYCAEEIKNQWEQKLLKVLQDQTKIVELNENNLELKGSVFGVIMVRTE